MLCSTRPHIELSSNLTGPIQFALPNPESAMMSAMILLSSDEVLNRRLPALSGLIMTSASHSGIFAHERCQHSSYPCAQGVHLSLLQQSAFAHVAHGQPQIYADNRNKHICGLQFRLGIDARYRLGTNDKGEERFFFQRDGTLRFL